MKVVINTKRGSFQLSNRQLHEYILRKYKTEPLYSFVVYDHENGTSTKRKNVYDQMDDNWKLSLEFEHPTIFTSQVSFLMFNHFYSDMINRDDPTLIEVIEEFNDNDKLKIFDIPDNIKWYIYESECGCESIHEEHRTWF